MPTFTNIYTLLTSCRLAQPVITFAEPLTVTPRAPALLPSTVPVNTIELCTDDSLADWNFSSRAFSLWSSPASRFASRASDGNHTAIAHRLTLSRVDSFHQTNLRPLQPERMQLTCQFSFSNHRIYTSNAHLFYYWSYTGLKPQVPSGVSYLSNH
ncbi:hypothetical protein HBI56_069450 [Parastagonospora nodorum]|uniref:Uncharacterized protein n=1 Tax=Phaeosphaeria nodorum (strain SN15 / ATCC MYA-4574 / FGSC 10173) TaxID=321614 RepID=A0A7U2EQV4_PHANO|nr:hypothetical protein HBH56_003890 [Parastagonospora nodorum]QRC90303.1 hypothetical protein JI435_097090 [Parastagonospora nodorum SN15]KAH3937587.1 hypothetical protein HBH54_003880 [Parastagonospora nodorum]KAH3946534.1 hypothetical protein HBH53_128100 [Parastagonospora nodorum]KAH3974926.1 hypothetical protein HBH51_086650 [Parastagonospora nodorum]